MCMGMVSRRASCPTEARDTKTRGATPAELQAGQANTVPFLSASFYDDATVRALILLPRCPFYARIISGRRTAARGRRRTSTVHREQHGHRWRTACIVGSWESPEIDRSAAAVPLVLLQQQCHATAKNPASSLRDREWERSSDKRGAQFSAHSAR